MLEDKMVEVNQKYSVISRNLASRVNDTVKFGDFSPQDEQLIASGQFPRHPKLAHNVYLSIKNDKAFLQAMRDIQAGEELFYDYGFSYWKSFYD